VNPKVGIVTTLYNYKRYIPELAKSILDQTYTNWEWVIVDDASTDNPEETLSKLNDSRIHRLWYTVNKGYSVRKNDGIRFLRDCDYFVMIDADDVLTPNSIQDRLEALQQNPDKLWIHADALNYELDGSIATTYIKWIKAKREEFLREGKDLTKWYHHRLIHSQTVMMRKEFYERLGLYDTKLRFSSDNELWRRAIRFGTIPMYIEKPVAIYRVHDDRMSRSRYKRERLVETKKYIINIVEQRFEEGINFLNTELL